MPSVLVPSQTTLKRKAMEDTIADSSPDRVYTGSGVDLSETSPQQYAKPAAPTGGAISDEDDDIDIIDELYVLYTTNIVGVQYYHGLVATGQDVALVRESFNRYDSNAIKVTTMSGEQVGHLPRDVTCKLGPLMDTNLVRPEGVVDVGNINSKHHTLPITLKIYGDARMHAKIGPRLLWATHNCKPRGRISSTEARSIRDSSSSQTFSSQPCSGLLDTPGQFAERAQLHDVLKNIEKANNNDRSSLLDQLCSTDDIAHLPEYPNPPGIESGDLNVDLLKHQRQALQWCHDHEYPQLPRREDDKPVQFWLYKEADERTIYYNMATKSSQTAAPILGRGALVGDSMGLGKTLTMLALIVATKADVPSDGHSASTLIVVPLSTISNWEKQIRDHCTPGTLSSLVYYGNNRSLNMNELERYDVIVTTYQTVAGEHANYVGMSSSKRAPTRKKPRHENSLMAMRWKRIILDEGHIIRNEQTKTAQAVYALVAQRRWVLTGTPIASINSPSDLGSMIRFLKVCAPLDNHDNFARLIIRPLKSGDSSGAGLLRALMAQICLRRTKEMQDAEGNPLVPLPPVEMTVVQVLLHPEARKLYDRVEQISRDRINRALDRTDGDIANISVTTNALSMLTRLRQLALHPCLVPANYAETLLKADEEDYSFKSLGDMVPQERSRLQLLLARAVEDNEECPVCMDVLDEPRIAICGHIFCLSCITDNVKRVGMCPLDRCVLTLSDIIEPAPSSGLLQLTAGADENVEEAGKAPELRTGSSAKIDQLVHLLSLTPSSEKSLVFSQFTSFLDKIAEALDEAGITHCRFDGRMPARCRQETLDAFSVSLRGDNEDEVPLAGVLDAHSPSQRNSRVMLISLKAGALGLNLTVANNVYLMDPWWQEGIESQAIDRCNRIGQTKTVHVFQLIAEDTVESKVLDIQEKKKTLIKEAFAGMKTKETQRQKKEARLQDLIHLFGVRLAASQSQSHTQTRE